MGIFLGLIGLAFMIIFGVMSLISLIKKDGKAKTRGILTAVCLVLFIAGITLTPKDETTTTKTAKQTPKTEVKKETKQEAPKAEPKKPVSYDIGFTPKEFEAKYNDFVVNQLKANQLQISVNVTSGQAQDVFEYKYNQHTFLQGSVKKDNGKIRDLSLVGMGMDTNESTKYLLTVGSLIAVTNPSLSAEERGKVMMQNLDFTNTIKNRTKTRTTVNGVEYVLSADEKLGIWFIVDNPLEKQ